MAHEIELRLVKSPEQAVDDLMGITFEKVHCKGLGRLVECQRLPGVPLVPLNHYKMLL